MTPEQALQLLDQVTSQISLSRAQHAQIQLALKVLAELIAKVPKT